MISRRQALLTTLFGASAAGLRALATGLPLAFLRDPRRALAAAATSTTDGACPSPDKAQFIIFSTSGDGDSINTSAPGTYEDPMIVHSPDPALGPVPLQLGSQMVTAAAPWAALPADVLARTVFWHISTGTPVHSQEPDVLRLMGATQPTEMLPSLLARQLAPCLGTIQSTPLSIGARTPSETLNSGGTTLPVVPPLAVRATLASPTGPLTALQSLRDSTLNQLYQLYKTEASPSQQRYLDALITSRQQLGSIKSDILDALSGVTDNGPDAQALVAVALIQMKVAPVVTIHIPFGGDNHHDANLAQETAQTKTGIATIAALMQRLRALGLQDQVTFMTLNVFGRTLGPGNADGRAHNNNHQVSLTIGRPFRGGMVGAVAPVDTDYGAVAIDSRTGAGGVGGDVQPGDSLAAFGQTMMVAVGGDASTIKSPGGTGKVIVGALA
ncbi:MAG TPA: DUF1501 domain-containing protein [Polyangia bacterium]